MPAVARVVSLAIAVLLTLLAPSPAFAAGEDAAEALISRGIELREKGKDDEALVVFRQALAKSPSARARAQVALAEQALGLWVNAEVDLAAALAQEDDPWIAKHRGALEGALAVVRRHLGSLEVRGNPGSEVYLDGVRLGALPSAPFRVEAGTRRLELRRAGFHPATRIVEVPAGGVARESLALVEDATAASPEGARAEGRAADLGRGQRVFGWALSGIGVAALAVGTTTVILREGEKAAYNEDVDAKVCPGVGKTQPKACQDRLDRVSTLLTVSLTSYVAGGVFLVGGIVVVATAPSAPRDPGRAPRASGGLSVRCAPGFAVSEASLSCSGTF